MHHFAAKKFLHKDYYEYSIQKNAGMRRLFRNIVVILSQEYSIPRYGCHQQTENGTPSLFITSYPKADEQASTLYHQIAAGI